MQLPEHQQPTRSGQPTPGQSIDPIKEQARKVAAAVDEVYSQPATSVRVDDPEIPSWRDGSRIGTAPPVPQPGRPPMSQRAVDLNTTILTSSVLTAALGGSATAVLWASGHADPTVVGLIVAAPAAFAIPIVALSRLAKRAKEVVEAAPPVINNHYTGNVVQDSRSISTTTRGVIANTRNQTS